jgi:hypothetical protein
LEQTRFEEQTHTITVHVFDKKRKADLLAISMYIHGVLHSVENKKGLKIVAIKGSSHDKFAMAYSTMS